MRNRDNCTKRRNHQYTVCHGGKFTGSIRQNPVRARYRMPFNTSRKSTPGDGRSSGASAEALQPATIPRLLDPSGNGGSSSRWRPPGPVSLLNRHPVFKRSLRLLTAAFAGDPARVDDLIVLSENAADRGGMDLEQASRPRTHSLTLVTPRHLSSYCAQLSSWASPMRSPSGPRI